MNKIQRFASIEDVATIESVIRKDGAVIIEGLLTDRELGQLQVEIMPFVNATAVGKDQFSGDKTTRTGALIARSLICRQMAMKKLVLESAKLFLKPYAAKIQLHSTQLIRIMPGQSKQLLHRDRLAWGGYLPAELEPQLNTMWAISDFTEANGATQVVPGSNLWDPIREAVADEIQFAEMKAGSVLVYSGSVIHGGGENSSNADRLGLIISYSLAWLRQEENQFLSCPPYLANNFDEALRDLLGYSMGSFALGYFSPPLPPGEGVETASPSYLFDGLDKAHDELYQQTLERAKEGKM